MSSLQPQRSSKEQPRPVRDLPGCIKYVILLFLLLLVAGEVASGEFRSFPEWNFITWIIVFVKLLLIALVIGLIKVQRNLKCQITDPTGCVEEIVDTVAGKLFVSVKGTAGGLVFGHYTLEINSPNPYTVTYPGGGGSGTAPVTNGELGRIETTFLDGGNYIVTMRVYPIGAGTSKSCSRAFSLIKISVYIKRVGNVAAMIPPANPNFYDETAELRTGAGNIISVGGTITIKGAAKIYGCVNRKIKRYDIRYKKVTAPGGEPAQPPMDALPPAWAVIPPLPLEYTLPTQYAWWTEIGPAQDLINSWATVTIFGSTYYYLSATSWGSTDSGRFSLLEVAEDTVGHHYFDIQHIWLDNFPIIGKIVKFQQKISGTWKDIPACTDLLLSFGTIRVVGLAWDPVIDTAWWPPVSPNDNFGHYQLDFWKQFSVVTSALVNVTSRVPALPGTPPVPTPTDADAGELAQWDLTQLDAATPSAVDPANKIPRGGSCTYTLQLFVTDTTAVNDNGTTHYVYHQVPVKIINDL
jgi:hypothetical protein